MNNDILQEIVDLVLKKLDDTAAIREDDTDLRKSAVVRLEEHRSGITKSCKNMSALHELCSGAVPISRSDIEQITREVLSSMLSRT